MATKTLQRVTCCTDFTANTTAALCNAASELHMALRRHCAMHQQVTKEAATSTPVLLTLPTLPHFPPCCCIIQPSLLHHSGLAQIS
jgi:hypothetical protein